MITKRKGARATLTAASVAIASLTLAGCSQGAGGDPGAGSEDIELTMYYPVAVGGPLTQVVDKLVASCAAEQEGVSVKAIYTGGYPDTMTKVQAAARANDAPELAVMLSSDLFTLTDQKLIAPLDEIGDVSWAKDRFYEAFLSGGIDSEGTLWSLPFQRSTIVQYYNRDIFKAAGLDPEVAPKTWDELRAAAKKVIDTKAADFGIEIPSTAYGYWLFQALAVQAGVEVTDGSGTATNFDNPEAVRALEFWKKLGDDKLAPAGTVEWSTTAEDFLQGRTAMMWTTTGNLSNVRKTAKFDFGVSALPSDKRAGSPTGGGNMYILKQATDEQRKAALEFAKCMTSPENAAQWSIDSGYVATGPAAWKTDKMEAYVADFPEAAVARDQLEDAISELATHDGGKVVTLANDAINAALNGQVSPADALAQLQSDIDKVLKPYR